MENKELNLTESEKILKECKEFFTDLLNKTEQESKISKEKTKDV